MFAARNLLLTPSVPAVAAGAAKTSIVLPNPGRVVYPLLPVLRQAMQGGKTPQRLSAADDPTKGAMNAIILPNAGSLVYPVLGALRHPRQGALALSSTSVAYLAAGAGVAAFASSASFTDTIPSGTNCSLIWAEIGNTSSFSASIGGVNATLVGNVQVDNTFGPTIFCFSLRNPPTGSQTVSVTQGGGNVLVIETVHYANVSSIGTPVTIGLQTGQPSMSVSSTNPNGMYANGFTYNGAATGNTFSAYNQTQRYVLAEVSGTNTPIIVGDAVGSGGTLIFSATRSDTTHQWGGLIVPLTP